MKGRNCRNKINQNDSNYFDRIFQIRFFLFKKKCVFKKIEMLAKEILEFKIKIK